MLSFGADIEAKPGGRAASVADTLPRWAWRLTAGLTVCAGMLHLLNLVGWGRWQIGPLMLTPFRAAFLAAWLMLIMVLLYERRLPRLDSFDIIIVVFSLLYFMRSLFNPETTVIGLNWLATAAGVYFLIKLGLRDKEDIRAVLFSLVAAIVAIAVFGLFEYAAKTNLFFDAIEINAIGADNRILASEQFYRVRSFVGHPGFAAAVLTSSIPLLMLVLWKRRTILTMTLAVIITVLFFTFSRGSWILAALVFLPLSLVLYRSSFKRYLQWAALALLLVVAVLMAMYWTRAELFVEFAAVVRESGIHWSEDSNSKTVVSSEGISSLERFMYFDIDPQSIGGNPESATVVVHYLDDGLGVLRVDYLTAGQELDDPAGWWTSPPINKTGTGQWTNAAFYLERPLVVDGDGIADIRIVDEDNAAVVRRVEMYEGRMDLVSQVLHQWESRSASLPTRFKMYPFAWDVARANPWGVGIFNSPGTQHHAVDSLPLTWLMEFGWAGIMLLLALVFLVVREGMRLATSGWLPESIFFLAIVMLLLHGGHLMILYDKPSIVMLSALAAIFTAIRTAPGGNRGMAIDFRDCYL